jgi:hypothetical protein
VRVRDPRRNEGQLWRGVTHPAVPPHDGVGRLDNANVHHCCENTIPGCVTRLPPDNRLRIVSGWTLAKRDRSPTKRVKKEESVLVSLTAAPTEVVMVCTSVRRREVRRGVQDLIRCVRTNHCEKLATAALTTRSSTGGDSLQYLPNPHWSVFTLYKFVPILAAWARGNGCSNWNGE